MDIWLLGRLQGLPGLWDRVGCVNGSFSASLARIQGRTATMALNVQKSAVGSKYLLKTRSSPGLPEWVASAQKDRLRGRPLHKKLRFKPEGESRWEREAPSLHLYLASVNLAPLVLNDLRNRCRFAVRLPCVDSTPVQFSQELSFFL